MKYKAVVCDMDGTLLNGEHRVSDRSRKIIKHITERGVKVFLASGRPYPDIQYFKESLGLNSYIISSNGAVVHDEKEKKSCIILWKKKFCPRFWHFLLEIFTGICIQGILGM
ncbi:HAD hydrolase, family IIB [Fusobacterium necrophorum subsp. funduliforme 1_1_36S]|nr:HAD hydrolase, family IIB [Fusobacterium necrophorum subsp. funduliforme 1_1_36S]